MGRTMMEKIFAAHSTSAEIKTGDIIELMFDLRIARDIGGATVVKQLQDNKLTIADPAKTFFSFDSNLPKSDKHAENMHLCRVYARANNIRIFDLESGIGTHLIIDQGFATPGTTLISGDPQANILGAIGAFGLGMLEKDIVTAFTKGKLWYRVPQMVKINLKGSLPSGLTAKDIGLNLYSIFGSDKLLGKVVELSGEAIDMLSLDSRISLASMAAELNAVIFLMAPNKEVIDYCSFKTGRNCEPILSDPDAEYNDIINLDIRKFTRKVIRAGNTPEIFDLDKLLKTNIESAFIGTSSNGRIEDLRLVAGILKGRKIAPNIIFKVTPATDEIWTQSLQEGLIDIFKESGAIVTNAGRGDGIYETGVESFGEIGISTGTPVHPGINIRGDIYLSSPAVVAAAALSGTITNP